MFNHEFRYHRPIDPRDPASGHKLAEKYIEEHFRRFKKGGSILVSHEEREEFLQVAETNQEKALAILQDHENQTFLFHQYIEEIEALAELDLTQPNLITLAEIKKIDKDEVFLKMRETVITIIDLAQLYREKLLASDAELAGYSASGDHEGLTEMFISTRKRANAKFFPSKAE